MSDAVSARASLRSSAAEVQKDRIIRGLLDAIVSSDKTVEGRELLKDDDAEATKPSLVEKYYAEA
ncbi:hypothetical protein RMR16_003250 [Agrobacterium sp. rho-13.3]|uniref:hypothetical protein n=1 Tax=Agrobacterium sp. rho-13.3 TaxID=3072980 RepID=UPI002A0B2F57|nr:hypothetical protein [Agrobacterium sp. rho-13.3]MDX8308825.1 hypothetical protein [Agrobacterium sp. rho-13.3]